MKKKISMLFALLLALVLLGTGCVPKYTAPEETEMRSAAELKRDGDEK